MVRAVEATDRGNTRDSLSGLRLTGLALGLSLVLLGEVVIVVVFLCVLREVSFCNHSGVILIWTLYG